METLDAVEARELSVRAEDLRDTAAEVLVDLEDTLPGILNDCYVLIWVGMSDSIRRASFSRIALVCFVVVVSR